MDFFFPVTEALFSELFNRYLSSVKENTLLDLKSWKNKEPFNGQSKCTLRHTVIGHMALADILQLLASVFFHNSGM